MKRVSQMWDAYWSGVGAANCQGSACTLCVALNWNEPGTDLRLQKGLGY